MDQYMSTCMLHVDVYIKDPMQDFERWGGGGDTVQNKTYEDKHTLSTCSVGVDPWFSNGGGGGNIGVYM